jgi:hypothetical protein
MTPPPQVYVVAANLFRSLPPPEALDVLLRALLRLRAVAERGAAAAGLEGGVCFRAGCDVGSCIAGVGGHSIKTFVMLGHPCKGGSQFFFFCFTSPF